MAWLVSESFQAVIDAVTKVSIMITEIAVSTTEQATGVTRIKGAVYPRDRITLGNVGSSEELPASVEILRGQICQFRAMLLL